MVKIVKDVKVPMDEIVSYLIEKGCLTDEFELGNIEHVEVKKEQIIKRSEIGGSLNSLSFRVNAYLNLNNYIKKNEIDKNINGKNKEESDDKKEDHNDNEIKNTRTFEDFLNKAIFEIAKELEIKKGGR